VDKLLTMSEKELTRLEVMQRLMEKHLKQPDAAQQLRLSVRHVKQLFHAYRQAGATERLKEELRDLSSSFYAMPASHPVARLFPTSWREADFHQVGPQPLPNRTKRPRTCPNPLLPRPVRTRRRRKMSMPMSETSTKPAAAMLPVRQHGCSILSEWRKQGYLWEQRGSWKRATDEQKRNARRALDRDGAHVLTAQLQRYRDGSGTGRAPHHGRCSVQDNPVRLSASKPAFTIDSASIP